MDGSVYVFARTLSDGREDVRQVVSVFAKNSDSARAILLDDLKKIQAVATDPEAAYNPMPDWTFEEIPLLSERVLTRAMTA